MTNQRNPNDRDHRPAWLAKMRDCDGKKQYDHAAAESTAAQIRKKEGGYRQDMCSAYECPHCNKWHVGHIRKS